MLSCWCCSVCGVVWLWCVVCTQEILNHHATLSDFLLQATVVLLTDSVSSFTAEYDCFTKGLIAAYCMVEMLKQVKHAIYVITESGN